jgi:endonuclease/exonuclease/phosphatase family metal-dependent hydrolase
MEIKTIQWNIGGGRIRRKEADATDPKSYKKDGLKWIIRFLKNLQKRESFDAITFQETHENASCCQLQIIARELDFPCFINDTYNQSFIDGKYRFGQGIISKYPIKEKHFHLFTNPNFKVPDKETGNEICSNNMGLTECVIQFPDNKMVQVETFHMVPFHFFNVRLQEERAYKVLREVESFAGKSKLLTIIQADFNLDFQSLNPFLPGILRNGFREVLQVNTTTPTGKRLDHVFCSGMNKIDSYVITDVLTDHYPVFTKFEI